MEDLEPGLKLLHGYVDMDMMGDVLSFGEESVLCFVCGKYYELDFFPAHVEDCERKRRIHLEALRQLDGKLHICTDDQIPTHSIPTNGNSELIAKYNTEAMECFQKGLIRCSRCSRSFHHERMDVHLRNCKGVINKDKKLVVDEVKLEEKKSNIICYLCGKEFVINEIESHHFTCLQDRQFDLQKYSERFQKAPEEIKTPTLTTPTENQDSGYFQKYNKQALKLFNNSLIPCKSCGRTFQPFRLEVHVKGCRPNSSPYMGSKPQTPERRASTAIEGGLDITI